MPVRHCLVTGANRGLGLEFVRQCLARGDRVVAACRHPGKASALNQLAGSNPGRLRVLPLDVTDPKSHAELVRELDLLGEEGEPYRLNLLINNAGVLHSGERFGRVSAANLEDSFRTNAMGPFLLTQALSEKLTDGAKVANITSELGSIAGLGRFGTPSYNISKAALNMATALLAKALADRKIAVVALHPGWAQTDMGGDQATLPAADSVKGLLQIIDGLKPAQSGGYFDWRGERLPW
jgi:NAD(P)-dependent dehydrogenase (short-subunit alcohol dehydrogenase family)